MIFSATNLRRLLQPSRAYFLLNQPYVAKLTTPSNYEDSSPLRGTEDLHTQQLQKFNYLIDTAKQHFKGYGLKEIITPIFERPSLFQQTLGQTSDIVSKEMFVLRTIDAVLRPEGTVSTIRAYVNEPALSGPNRNDPVCLYYCGPFFRHERPQFGRYRQFHQIGVEFLGSTSPMSDVDCLECAHSLLGKWGIRTELKINTVGDADTRRNYNKVLKQYFETHKSSLSELSRERLSRGSILRILDSKEEADKNLLENCPKITNHLSAASEDRWKELCQDLTHLGIDYTIDPYLVRGLDYYDHTLFEFLVSTPTSSAPLAVLAGGRYDDIALRTFGVQLPGIGWAAGIQRLALLLGEYGSVSRFPVVSVISISSADRELTARIRRSAMEVARELRRNDFCVLSMMSDVKLTKQLRRASKEEADWSVFIGEDEFIKGNVKVKDMVKGVEKTVEKGELVDFFNGKIQVSKLKLP
eukprot:TRINITY_DN6401_c0_g1_i1.p1 TRINITY_DN6401_c0_g1~~TRINITY_DN6401_c0_g1_i1.p1  ORF type:complete len:469 (+),score=66.57 TRINITY_DN6401_c0_g1_i1:77-1483(+)